MMLVLHARGDRHSRYSRYLIELLRLEGFADYAEGELAHVRAETLADHDLVLLPRVATTLAQVQLLTEYVRNGGKLLAFHPDPGLAQHFGLRPTQRGIVGGYLQIAPRQAAVAGLFTGPTQVIVPAAGWSPAEGADLTILAEVRTKQPRFTVDRIPGVVHARLGRGEAILWAYDLPHAVARLRQGNPERADLCLGGLDGIYRPGELFIGQLDPEREAIPQADVQTALLARTIEMLASYPRLWYYPEAAQRGALIMTSDDDWSTVEQFELLVRGLREREATCTFYLVPDTRLPRDRIAAWEAEGHTFSAHPALAADYRKPPPPTEVQQLAMPTLLRDTIVRHERTYARPVRTLRNHCVRWLGYVEAAQILADEGVRMETNYLSSCLPFGLGYLCGSGRPLRFVDPDGAVIDCFQQPTSWTEECLINPSMIFSLKWSVHQAITETTRLLRRATREFYTPVTINSHPVSYATYTRQLIDENWDTARREGLPILSADRWLAWTETRDRLRLHRRAGDHLLSATQDVPAVTVLFPPGAAPRVDGAEVSTQELWGREYTAVTLRSIAAGETRPITC
jgi:hypothetical protein